MSSFELLVLGSGGPEADLTRASSAHLLLIDGTPRVMVDCGGGALTRIGQARLDPATIELILLTHLHPDHSGEIGPFLWATYLAGMDRPMMVIGPAGRDDQSGIGAFIDAVLGPDAAWGKQLRRLEGFGLSVVEWPSDLDGSVHRISQAGLRITASAVRHGPEPALAYRIEPSGGGGTVTFSGDVDRSDEALIALARGTDLLVHCFGVRESEVGPDTLLARPSAVGRTAGESGCAALLLSHMMHDVEADLEASTAIVRRAYRGPVNIASDLSRWPIKSA